MIKLLIVVILPITIAIWVYNQPIPEPVHFEPTVYSTTETNKPTYDLSLNQCQIVGDAINLRSSLDLIEKFVASDCDRRLGASTRDARVNEIKKAFR